MDENKPLFSESEIVQVSRPGRIFAVAQMRRYLEKQSTFLKWSIMLNNNHKTTKNDFRMTANNISTSSRILYWKFGAMVEVCSFKI